MVGHIGEMWVAALNVGSGNWSANRTSGSRDWGTAGWRGEGMRDWVECAKEHIRRYYLGM